MLSNEYIIIMFICAIVVRALQWPWGLCVVSFLCPTGGHGGPGIHRGHTQLVLIFVGWTIEGLNTGPIASD